MSAAAPLTVVVDVTDTVDTEWRAGIQRVVCRLVAELGDDPRLQVVPVVWLESARSFRRLTPQESARLAPDAPVVAPVTGVDAAAPDGAAPLQIPSRNRPPALDSETEFVTGEEPVGAGVRARAVGLLRRTGLESVARRARRRLQASTRDRHLVPLVYHPPAGSVLLEMDTVWNNLWVDRGELLAQLHDRGVHVAVLVYDLLPQRHPEWFEPTLVEVSNHTLRAQMSHAELVFAISGHTAADLADWNRTQRLTAPDAVVVTLGADLPGEAAPAATLPAELDGHDYVLVVGTVEPRKNHTVLLDAFDRWQRLGSDLHLVVVGRPGWHNDDVIARLESHPEAGRTLHWWRRCDDATLAALYRSATVVAVPSITEGFGLPVIEALSYGTPVVASNGGTLPEAAAGHAALVAPDDIGGWVQAIVAHDHAAHRARVVASLQGYRPPSWTDRRGNDRRHAHEDLRLNDPPTRLTSRPSTADTSSMHTAPPLERPSPTRRTRRRHDQVASSRADPTARPARRCGRGAGAPGRAGCPECRGAVAHGRCGSHGDPTARGVLPHRVAGPHGLLELVRLRHDAAAHDPAGLRGPR